MFKRCLNGADHYLEYGSGASTSFALNLESLKSVTVVETDMAFIWAQEKAARERFKNGGMPALTLHDIDLGPVGLYGFPETWSKMETFAQYWRTPWEGTANFDLVLIDGRFRVSTFLWNLVSARPGTTIIWDDYFPRTRYHVVEHIIKPLEKCGRQARFEVPDSLDVGEIHRLISEFRMVLE